MVVRITFYQITDHEKWNNVNWVPLNPSTITSEWILKTLPSPYQVLFARPVFSKVCTVVCIEISMSSEIILKRGIYSILSYLQKLFFLQFLTVFNILYSNSIEFLVVIPGSKTIPNFNISDRCIYNLITISSKVYGKQTVYWNIHQTINILELSFIQTFSIKIYGLF